MPPPAAPPKPGGPKGKPGKGGFLGKRIGPVPMWLILGAGVGLIIVAYMYYRGKAGQEGGTYDLGLAEATPMERASGGGPSANAAPYQQLDPAVIDEAITSQITSRLSGADAYMNELRGQIKDIEDALEGQGWNFEDQMIKPPQAEQFVSPATVVDAIISGNGGVQEAPAKRKPPQPKQKPKQKGKPKQKAKKPPAHKPKPKPKPRPKQKPRPQGRPPQAKQPPRKVAPPPKKKAPPPRRPMIYARSGAGGVLRTQ